MQLVHTTATYCPPIIVVLWWISFHTTTFWAPVVTDVPIVNIILAWNAFWSSCKSNSKISAHSIFCTIMNLKYFSSLLIVRKIGCLWCSNVVLTWVGVFWTLHTTWDCVVDLDGIIALITRNWVAQYLHTKYKLLFLQMSPSKNILYKSCFLQVAVFQWYVAMASYR